jgi:thiamine-monophosphate kinase
MDENSLLKLIFPLLNQGKDIIVGPGDDCAVIDIGDTNKYYLISTDQIISNVHFNPLATTPKEAGAKLIKRNISDIAAMGGKPAHAVITIASGNYDEEWLLSFYKGLSEEANKWDISICGGDIAALPINNYELRITNEQNSESNNKPIYSKSKSLLVTTLTITGYVDKNKLCLRKSAKPNDILFTTGLFGNSYLSKHHLTFNPRINEAEFLATNYSNTIMDVTDGLLIDLERIAKASNVTIELDTEKIPFRHGTGSLQNALTDGEDYELIFTVPEEKAEKLIKEWPFETELTKIGRILNKIKNLDVVELSEKTKGRRQKAERSEQETIVENKNTASDFAKATTDKKAVTTLKRLDKYSDKGNEFTYINLIEKYTSTGWDHLDN